MPDTAPGTANSVAYKWLNPFGPEGQLREDERAIRDIARAYVKEKLLPRITQAYLTETTYRAIFSELGAMGLLGVTIPEKYGCAGTN
jgi:glutaryl-CoA dehydrogenase